MVFSHTERKTQVQALGFASKASYPYSVQALLKIASFLRWMGILPIVITSTSSGLLRISFARFHITSFLWLATIVLQIVLTIDHACNEKTLAKDDLLVYALFLGGIFCSTIIIPRITLASIPALEMALNTLIGIQGSLESTSTRSKLWYVSILVLLLEFLTIIPNTLKVYFTYDDSKAIRTAIFTLSTGNPGIGILMYGTWEWFYYISLWSVPIQLFMFCRTLSSYYLDLAEKIRHDLHPDALGPNPVEIVGDMGRNRDSTLRARLKTLQATAVMLEKAVSAVNAYIGMALLLYVMCHFLNILDNLYVVSKCAQAVVSGDPGGKVVFANVTMMLLRHTAELLFVIWTADLLPSAAHKCKEVVLGIPFCTESFNGEPNSSDMHLHFFRSYITAMNVEISAFGLFTISRKIIPNVLGTIVTYYLIVVQYARDYGSGIISTVAMTNSTNETL